MCKNYIRKIDKYAKKIKAIRELGGKCKICDETDYYKLAFHHIDGNKEKSISKLIDREGWTQIKKEIKKCELLCHNCHHELHNEEQNNNTITKNNKKLYLEFKNINRCEKCGYNRCNLALDFHHVNGKTKILNISSIKKNIIDIKEDIENELNKCIVLCRNCHMSLHYDNGFLKENSEEINKRINRIENKKEKHTTNIRK